jgi:uncharacterized membrane protein
VAEPRSSGARARAKELNARIGYACLPIFVCIALARGFQEISKPLAVVALIAGVCFWIYMMTLVVRRLRVR